MSIRQRYTTILVFLVLLLSIIGCSGNTYSDIAQQESANNLFTSYDEGVSANDTASIRKFIEYWDFDIEVQNASKVLGEIEEKTYSLKGYIVESQVNNYDKSISAYLTIKVPQEITSEMTKYLQTIGKVTSSSNRTEDITMEYYDTQARLEVLQKQEERLLSIMEGQTNDIQDLLAVEQEISRVRAERESLQARMNYLNNATSYSQISIHLKQESLGEISAPQGTWGKAVQGLITSVNSLINLGNSLIILLFRALPYLVIIAIVYIIVKNIRQRRENIK